MTTVLPVNPRGSVDAHHVKDFRDDDGKVPAGYFHFVDGYDGTKDVCLLFGCPCGCGSLHAVAVKPYDGAGPTWDWDGNRDQPTLTPSILSYQLNNSGERIGEHWHGFLTAGRFVSC